MKISSINPYTTQNYNPAERKTKNQSFGSICADATLENQWLYSIHVNNTPGFFRIKGSYTRIFRELSSELAISKLTKQKNKTEIKILGSSDGSEAWAYAIAQKENNPKAKENVKIKGVDIANYMTETAKTGCIVMSDIEKDFAQYDGNGKKDESPLKGDGWNKYLKKTTRPAAFDEILQNYPFMKYLENDIAVEKSIGTGLNWYEINKDGLPKVEFETGDMRENLTPDKESDTEIYVMANSSAYVLQKNPDDFIKMFDDIKEQTKDKKEVYVVLGELENTLLNSFITNIPPETKANIQRHIKEQGFKQLPQEELQKLGIKDYKNTSQKIYRLENQTTKD